MQNLKEKLKIYIELTRLNKPSGILLLLIPCLWALAFAGHGDISFKYLWTFILGAILMRSAGCIINDIFDKEIDKHVERTKNRPLAADKIDVHEAFIIAFLCSIISFFLIVSYIPFESIVISMLSIPLIVLYPTTKRYFILPQLVLGITFNIGVFVAWMCYKPINLTSFVLYIGCIFWTLGYDTIYALNDVEDDIKQKINSGAVLFRNKTKLFISMFYSIFICCLLFVGLIESLGSLYYASVFLYLLAILWMLKNLFYKNNYTDLFNQNVYHGIIFWILITAQYYKDINF